MGAVRSAIARRQMDALIGLLERSEAIVIAGQINQLAHSLQTATHAWRAGAPADLVCGALMHDVGRLVAPATHGRASAELIAPFVTETTYWVVRIHDEIRLPDLAGDGPVSRAADYAGEPWFPLALTFAEEWDRYGFSRSARALPLAFFRPMLEELCRR